MPKRFAGRIDMTQNEILRLRLENLMAYPAGAKLGSIFFHATERTIKYCIDDTDTSLAEAWRALDENIFDKSGNTIVAYDGQGRISMVTTILPGPITRVQNMAYGVTGYLETIVTSIAELDFIETQTFARDVNGNVTGITYS